MSRTKWTNLSILAGLLLVLMYGFQMKLLRQIDEFIKCLDGNRKKGLIDEDTFNQLTNIEDALFEDINFESIFSISQNPYVSQCESKWMYKVLPDILIAIGLAMVIFICSILVCMSQEVMLRQFPRHQHNRIQLNNNNNNNVNAQNQQIPFQQDLQQQQQQQVPQ